MQTGGKAAGRPSAALPRHDADRLLETMATGFIALDSDWYVDYVNSEGAQVLAGTADTLVGRRLWDIYPGLEDTEFGVQYRQAVATGETLRFTAHYPHLRRWYEVRAVPSADPVGLALYFLDVTARRADQDRAEAASARLELLAAVGAELADVGLDTESAVARLAQIVVPVLGDWCIVSLATPGSGLKDVGVWHADPALQETAQRYSKHRLEGRTELGPIQRARDGLHTVIVEHGLTAAVLPTLGCPLARAALEVLAPESAVVVPLLAHGQFTGILTLLRGAGRSPATPDEVAVANEVGARAALALDNARLYAQQRTLAEGLQRSLLTTPPDPDYCQIAVRYAPAAQVASVGGDWFDAFLQADGGAMLVIGDVMGHDVVAAAAMGQLRTLLRGIAWHSGAGPAEALRGLDRAMRGLQVDTSASAVVARLEHSAGEGGHSLSWSNAGHPPPLALHPDGTVTTLEGAVTDLLLGIDADSPRGQHAAAVAYGTTVLLYTDGLIERRGQDLDQGLDMLRTTLAELGALPLEELCDQVLLRMLAPAPEDDVALVAVRLHRAPREA